MAPIPKIVITDYDQNESLVQPCNVHYQTELIDKARSRFAINAEKGIEFIIKHNLIENNPIDIANFLLNCNFLDRHQMGLYLAQPSNQTVLSRYLKVLDFVGLTVEDALRRFLMRFRLPGEAQQIDYLLEMFSRHYVTTNNNECNGGEEDVNLIHLLTFSLVLLNTDLHNPNNTSKMSRSTFISNCQAHLNNQHLLLSTDSLGKMYDSIAKQELTMETEGVFDYPLSGPDIEGVLWKKGDRFHSWNRRWCVVANQCLYYFYGKKDKSPRGVIPLENLVIRALDRRGKFRFEITSIGDVDFDTVDSSYSHNSSYLNTVPSQGQRRSSDPILSSSNVTITSTSLSPQDPHRTVTSERGLSLTGSSLFNDPLPLLGLGQRLPVIKSAKYVRGRLVEGRRDRFIFQCNSEVERDQWVSTLQSKIIINPSKQQPINNSVNNLSIM